MGMDPNGRRVMLVYHLPSRTIKRVTHGWVDPNSLENRRQMIIDLNENESATKPTRLYQTTRRAINEVLRLDANQPITGMVKVGDSVELVEINLNEEAPEKEHSNKINEEPEEIENISAKQAEEAEREEAPENEHSNKSIKELGEIENISAEQAEEAERDLFRVADEDQVNEVLHPDVHRPGTEDNEQVTLTQVETLKKIHKVDDEKLREIKRNSRPRSRTGRRRKEQRESRGRVATSGIRRCQPPERKAKRNNNQPADIRVRYGRRQ